MNMEYVMAETRVTWLNKKWKKKQKTTQNSQAA